MSRKFKQYSAFALTILIGVTAGSCSKPAGGEPASHGRTLFYRTATHMMAAAISTSPEFVVTRRDTLFADVCLRGVERTHYDVLGNGSEFLMVRRGLDQQRAIVVRRATRADAASNSLGSGISEGDGWIPAAAFALGQPWCAGVRLTRAAAVARACMTARGAAVVMGVLALAPARAAAR